MLVLAVGAVTYATRLAGFRLGQRAIPPALDRCLVYVPVAVFAALILPDVHLGGADMLPRLGGVLTAALVVLRFRRLWLGLGAGLGAFWLMAGLGG